MPAGADKAIVGDWDSDGIQRRDHALERGHRQLGAAELDERRFAQRPTGVAGPAATTRSSPATGIADGRFDDMIIWDRDTGNYVRPIVEWLRTHVPRRRHVGARLRQVDRRRLRRRRATSTTRCCGTRAPGNWVVQRWAATSAGRIAAAAPGRGPTTRSSSATGAPAATSTRRSCGTARPGSWALQSWANFRWRYVRQRLLEHRDRHRRPRRLRHTTAASTTSSSTTPSNGSWAVWSFHRNVPSTRLSGTWLNGYDVISVGSFMD